MVRLVLFVVAMVACSAGETQAAANVAVSLNATVMPVCRFFTAAPVVNIRNVGTSGRNIDPSTTVTGTGSAAIRYRCTNQTMPTFTVPATVTLTCGGCPGTPTMPAVITSTNDGAGRGLGAGGGRNRTLTVTGQITPAVFQNARAGAYSGTMTITVTP
jgi:hypothetical protein